MLIKIAHYQGRLPILKLLRKLAQSLKCIPAQRLSDLDVKVYTNLNNTGA